MKRIVIWLASTVTILVLLFGYHTSTNSRATAGTGAPAAPATAPAGQAPGTPATQAPSSRASRSSASTSSAPASGASSAATKTYTGTEAQTRWGPVQVEITVAAKGVTAVDVVEYPQNNPRDQQINAYALPILVQDTVDAQSAKIDAVSGATVTSDGYVQSLQSALDQAGI